MLLHIELYTVTHLILKHYTMNCMMSHNELYRVGHIIIILFKKKIYFHLCLLNIKILHTYTIAYCTKYCCTLQYAIAYYTV